MRDFLFFFEKDNQDVPRRVGSRRRRRQQPAIKSSASAMD